MKIFKDLEKCYQDVLNNNKNVKKLVKLMSSDELQDEIMFFMSFPENKQLLTEKDDIENLKSLIKYAQTIFNYSGEYPGMSDTTYDFLYELLEDSIDGELEITVPLVNQSNVVKHKYVSLRGTLDKIYYLDEDEQSANPSRSGLPEWVRSAQRRIYERTGRDINLWNEEVLIFPKWDGVSAIFEFLPGGVLDRVLTRGYTVTNEAQLITHVFKDWFEAPIKDNTERYGLKTEVMMREDDLYKYNEEMKTSYKNSRSIVSSILNSDECDDRINYLKVMQLRTSTLDDNGEESLQTLAPGAFNEPYLRCKLNDTNLIREFAYSHKYVYGEQGLRCDGAVIHIINPEIQKILGRENNKQKYEVAFKFTEEAGYSKVVDINFTTGLFGRINPVLEIEPIVLKGNTITNISLGSIARFNDLKLRKGDTIKILYDIIPYAVMDDDDPKCKRKKGELIEMPTVCPDCGEDLEISDTGSILKCVNEECPCREKGKILNYLQKMNIDGISYATIDTLYDLGFLKKIPDLYKLEDKRKKLYDIPGFGEKSIDTIIDSINSKLSVTYAELLGSLGIESVGRKMFEKVCKYFTIDDLHTLVDTDNSTALEVVPGIKEKTAMKILNGLKDNAKIISKLEDVLDIDTSREATPDFTIAFTKVRPDEEMTSFIQDNGGKIVDSMTKDTSILCIPMKSIKSSKVDKAVKYGIPIVVYDELKEFITLNV